MMSELTEAFQGMPPNRLILIVGGGVGAGLAWRWYSRRRSGGVSAPVAESVDYLNTALPTVGNDPAMFDVGNRRSLYGDTVDLPIQSYVLSGPDGTRYITNDAGQIVPLNGNTPTDDTDDGSPGAGYVKFQGSWVPQDLVSQLSGQA